MQLRSPATTGRLSSFRLAIFAAAGVPIGAFVVTLSVYLPPFYASQLGLNLGAVGIAFMAVRVADILLDPALGLFMDRTVTPVGRFRPWLLAAVPVLIVGTYAIYLPQPGAGTLYLTFWLLVLYAGYSMGALSHAAWGAALVEEYHQRNRVYGWIQAVGVIGAVGVLFAPIVVERFLHTKVQGVLVMGWFVLLTIPLTFAITGFFAPEHVLPSHLRTEHFAPRDYLALMSRPDMVRNMLATLLTTLGPALSAPLYLFFFQEARGYSEPQTRVLLIIYILAGLPGPAFWTFISARFGKHHTIKIAALAYGIAQTVLLLLPRAHPLEMSFAMFSVGFIASAFAFLLRAMVADLCDEVRLETGKDRAALLFALWTSDAKIASTIAVGISYPLLALFGFNAAVGAVNTPLAMFGLQALYLVPPVTCVLLGGLSMFGYRLDEKRHGEIRMALSAKAEMLAMSVTESKIREAIAPSGAGR
jgi:Na+/melibiose symporter-like transporter